MSHLKKISYNCTFKLLIMLSLVVVYGIMVLSVFLPSQFDGKYTEFELSFLKNVCPKVLNAKFFSLLSQTYL